MKRISMGALAATLAIGAAACSSNAFEPIAVTKSASTVASCENLGDVTAGKGDLASTDATTLLTREAHAKGGNTLLIASDDADKGTAYRCSMPSVTSTGKSGNTGSR